MSGKASAATPIRSLAAWAADLESQISCETTHTSRLRRREVLLKSILKPRFLYIFAAGPWLAPKQEGALYHRKRNAFRGAGADGPGKTDACRAGGHAPPGDPVLRHPRLCRGGRRHLYHRSFGQSVPDFGSICLFGGGRPHRWPSAHHPQSGTIGHAGLQRCISGRSACHGTAGSHRIFGFLRRGRRAQLWADTDPDGCGAALAWATPN